MNVYFCDVNPEQAAEGFQPLGLPGSPQLASLLSHKCGLYPAPPPVHDTAVPPVYPKCHCLGLGLLITALFTNCNYSTYRLTPVFPGLRRVRKITSSGV